MEQVYEELDNFSLNFRSMAAILMQADQLTQSYALQHFLRQLPIVYENIVEQPYREHQQRCLGGVVAKAED